MSKKMINNVNLEGLLYEHALEFKETGPNSKNPGTKFITGTISIATDDKLVNIVPVHFTYVTATTSRGTNANFNILSDIINENLKTVMKHGADVATKIRVDTNIGLNEFYSDRDGQETLVSAKRNEGGFLHLVSALSEDPARRNYFKTDILITGVTHKDADEENDLPEKVIVKGAIFDFRKALLPVEFAATHPDAIAYFEGLGASQKNPVFTCVWGTQISETTSKTYVEKSAFGEDYVRTVPSSHKEFLITGASPEPYDWNDENTLTEAEVIEMMKERETYLATVKQRRDEYLATKNATTSIPGAVPNNGGFNF